MAPPESDLRPSPPELTAAQIARKETAKLKREEQQIRTAYFKEAFSQNRVNANKIKDLEGRTSRSRRGTETVTVRATPELSPVPVPAPVPMSMQKRVRLSSSLSSAPSPRSPLDITSDDESLPCTPSKREATSSRPRPSTSTTTAIATVTSTTTTTTTTTTAAGARTRNGKPDATVKLNPNPTSKLKPKKVDKPVFAPRPLELPTIRTPLWLEDEDDELDWRKRTRAKGTSKVDSTRIARDTPTLISDDGLSTNKTLVRSLKRTRSKAVLMNETSGSEDDDDVQSNYQPSTSVQKGKGKGKEVAKEAGAGGGEQRVKGDETKDLSTPRKAGRPKKVTPTSNTDEPEAGPSTPSVNKRTSMRTKKNAIPTPTPTLTPTPTPMVFYPPSDCTPEPDSPVRARSPSPARKKYQAEANNFFAEMSRKSLQQPERYIPGERASSELSSAPSGDSPCSDFEACEDDKERQVVDWNRDQAELCPICRKPLPIKPTPEFNILYEKYRIQLPTHEEHSFAFCALHKALISTVPLARYRQYPETIDYTGMWEKIVGVSWIQKRIQRLCDQPVRSSIFREHALFIHEHGKSRWTKRAREPIMVHNATPGYYGTLGGLIVERYIEELGDWGLLTLDKVDKEKYTPLSRKELIRQVMVQEISIMLIMSDRFGWPVSSLDKHDAARSPSDPLVPSIPAETFERVWEKANDVRDQSIEYGRYLNPDSLTEGRIFRQYLDNKVERERQTRELWGNIGTKTVIRKVKRPRTRQIIDICASPDPKRPDDNVNIGDHNDRAEASSSHSQPFMPMSSPISELGSGFGRETSLKPPSLVMPDWNRQGSDPRSTPGSTNSNMTKTQKRKSRKTKPAAPGNHEAGEQGEETNVSEYGSELDRQKHHHATSSSRLGARSSLSGNAQSHQEQVAGAAKGGSTMSHDQTDGPSRSQDPFDDLEVGSQEMKAFRSRRFGRENRV